MRLVIVAMLTMACALVAVASAQTAGPTLRTLSAPGGEVKTAPDKAGNARRVLKKRLVRRGGRAAPAKAVPTTLPRPPAPQG